MGRVLAGLKHQTLPRSQWELLLIDNASSQSLDRLFDLSWHPRHACIRENELGLTAARLRGIRETAGQLLLFIDDDNVLAPDYLERLLTIERAFPHLGVFGAGVIEPEFEIPPRPELAPLLGQLALRASSSQLWTNNTKDGSSTPWGAGLCVTRQTAGAYLQLMAALKISHVLDRFGERLYCGGDDLFSWVSARNGLGFGVFPELRITHLIGAHRLTRSYFLRLVHDHSYSHGILNYLFFGEEQPQLGVERVLRMLLHGARHGWFSMRCLWAAARGERGAAHFLAERRMQPIGAQSKEVVALNALLLVHSVGGLVQRMFNS
jgi:glycosyltransferase involved in cell wall biosynthesis